MADESAISRDALSASTDAVERADVLAYLARKRANAETMAARSPEFAEEARTTVRAISVLEDDIRGGLHCGEAAL